MKMLYIYQSPQESAVRFICLQSECVNLSVPYSQSIMHFCYPHNLFFSSALYLVICSQLRNMQLYFVNVYSTFILSIFFSNIFKLTQKEKIEPLAKDSPYGNTGLSETEHFMEQSIFQLITVALLQRL